MHICIIGNGFAGLLAGLSMSTNQYVKKITLIGSPTIPSIGVGESTTIGMNRILKKIGISDEEFIRNTDASIKYGVYYKNWSKRDYIHYIKSHQPWNRQNISAEAYAKLLANKPKNVHIHDLIGKNLFCQANKNNVLLDKNEYPHTWHFDASKGIQFLKSIIEKNNIVELIHSNVVDCTFQKNDLIKSITLDDGNKIAADYYINATGNWEFNSKVFKTEYESLSNILLTNKAIFAPIEYSNKRKQFHPYTVAKTMNCGWRWITPIWSRIGSGYVFSTNYITEDQAIDEFLEDVGDKSIEPRVVNFSPKYNKKTFRINSCSIGMANGFLEPLDAPGIAIISVILGELDYMLEAIQNKSNLNQKIDIYNQFITSQYMWWASFIFCQYKTCFRNDTNFWKDCKNLKFEFYEKIFESIDDFNCSPRESMMICQTISSKDIQWKTSLTELPFPIPENFCETISHLDYINHIRN